ncbi:hypothetical protein [Myroides odoratus]|uniref:hypothetical protein n=1 Tax=Myroides odoratus TaxID=256 RepID=UPI00333E7AA1
MKNRFIYILLAFVICSCDPMDDRMVFNNQSTETVFVRMIFIEDEIKGTMIGLRKMEAKKENRLGKLYTWESEFENTKDSILSIVVFKDYVFLNDQYESSNKIKSDSLLKIGDYEIHQYSYAELKKKNWQVNYPDDGFKLGKPLITIANTNRSNSDCEDL